MIKVYSKQNCAQCTFTKRKLDDLGLPYEEVDVTIDEQALEELREHAYSSLPVVTVGGFDNSWSGFRPDRLEALVHE